MRPNKARAPGFNWHRKLLFAEHHRSHAASAFYPSPFDEALILTIDGVGEWAYSAGDRKERDDFTPKERKLILILARKAEPHVYWINWVCSSLERELQRWPTPAPSTSSVSMGSGS
jgi:hypothetical protein